MTDNNDHLDAISVELPQKQKGFACPYECDEGPFETKYDLDIHLTGHKE